LSDPLLKPYLEYGFVVFLSVAVSHLCLEFAPKQPAGTDMGQANTTPATLA